MNPSAKNSAEDQAIDKALSLLREFFDNVQIFADRLEGEDTLSFAVGSGNWNARLGLVGRWLKEKNQPVSMDDGEPL